MCYKCLKGLLKNGTEKNQRHAECPSCGAEIDTIQCWKDVFADKELDRLEVYCLYESVGCEWICVRSKLREHTLMCGYQPVSCTNEGCQELVPKLQLKSHALEKCLHRILTCTRCNKKLHFSEKDVHEEVCPKAFVSCPNFCEISSLRREDVESHLQTCPKRKAQCSVFGCPFEGIQEEINQHENETGAPAFRDHIKSVSSGCKEMKRELDKLDEKVDEKNHDFRNLQRGNQKAVEALTQRVTAVETGVIDMQARQKVVQAKIVETCYQSVDNAQKEYLTKFANLEKHFRIFTEKMLKMEETITSQATRICSLEEELSVYRKDSGRGSLTGSGSSLFLERQMSQQDHILGCHDVRLAEHGLRIDMLDCKNTDGVLLWKITEVGRRRREAVSGKTPSIYSQPFYSSACGYKLCARLYLNGDGMGKGTHLSLFFVVMRGEYDALLPWPFQPKVTLVLVDPDGRRHVSDTFRPDPNSSSFKKPHNELNIASGCPLFVPLSSLDNGSYIKDDTIFIKIVIGTAGLEKPDGRNDLW